MNIEWIEHKGKKILFVDFKGCRNDDDRMQIFNKYLEEIKKVSSKVLLFFDFTDNFVSESLLKKANESSEWTKKNIDKAAILGITGVKKVLLNSFKIFTKIDLTTVNTREEALEHLIK
jgi:hypothetical protein